jgi:hypothetical protein
MACEGTISDQCSGVSSLWNLATVPSYALKDQVNDLKEDLSTCGNFGKAKA